MKKELEYFTIEDAFGGNQDWFTNVVMHIGGCAAAMACDTCIYMAKVLGMKELYPFDEENLTKKEYVAFSQMMKPYLKPRVRGVCRLWMYTDGFEKYLEKIYERPGNEQLIRMEEFAGDNSCGEAKKFLKRHIDCQMPVPYLLLQHTDREKFQDFIWHWFLIVGYEERDGRFFIRAATYGEETWLDLEELWNTGSEEKGGLIGYEIISAETGSAKV